MSFTSKGRPKLTVVSQAGEEFTITLISAGDFVGEEAVTPKAVDGRLRRLAQARQMVVEDPKILSGTPVIKGTRVPLYDVAAAVDLGTLSNGF